MFFFFFFNDTATTEIYTLSLHDALPISMIEQDEGGARLGELALVDREGRIGPLDTVFYDTLLDENAASHVALGSAYDAAVGDEDRERLSRSSIHVDFMIGSSEVDVTGITRDGDRIAVLRNATWQI